MANESRVYEAPQGGAATHALIIGVGAYPRLVGGTPPRLAENQGLGQLTSPPVSARAVARWMIDEFQNADRPLASVRLLVSDDPPVQFAAQQGPVVPPRATIGRIEQAVREWVTDGNHNAENQLLFYFCGHGIGANSVLALLAEDFGEDPLNPLDGAIDFGRFHNGMGRCEAKYQCFFIDACRSDADLLAYSDGVAGRWFLTKPSTAPKKLQPAYYSTQKGELAHGPPNQPSYFTQALLRGLGGTGSTRRGGEWQVNTVRLLEAVSAHMKRSKKSQIPPADDLAEFPITRRMEPPKVPVFVRCAPPNAHAQVTLRCRNSNETLHDALMALEEVQLELTPGEYTFEALAGAPYANAVLTEYVWPPECPIEIEVVP